MGKYKIAILLIIAIIVGGMIFVVVFYWQNLRGLSPAIQKPSQDISEILEKQKGKSGDEVDIPLKLPKDFSISIFAKGLGSPRVLTYDSAGHIITSVPSQGKVYALVDGDNDGFAENNVVVAENLDRPHGLAMRCGEESLHVDGKRPKPCQIYIAENDQVAVYDYDEENLKAINKKKIIDLPSGGVHYTRTIMFMPYPDHDKLLISVGSSCNVCEEKDWRRTKILSANYDGSDLKVFASGLRNAVFMAIHPVDGKIWATEMGRDFLGDDLPPDEINIIEEGKNYGWPVCYGKNIHDDVYDKNTYIRNPCMQPFEESSYIDIPAHSAPLGMAFFPEEGWPQDYWHNLLVAYHGSWNRTEPTGYKLVRYRLDENGRYLGDNPAGSSQGEDFISGWLSGDGTALGRPVDILIQPGGTIYVSDDKAGVIYKVLYTGLK